MGADPTISGREFQLQIEEQERRAIVEPNPKHEVHKVERPQKDFLIDEKQGVDLEEELEM